MSKETKILKPLSIAIGATFAVSMAASNIASAAPAGDNPFAMSELESGYMQVAGKNPTPKRKTVSAAKANAAKVSVETTRRKIRKKVSAAKASVVAKANHAS